MATITIMTDHTKQRWLRLDSCSPGKQACEDDVHDSWALLVWPDPQRERQHGRHTKGLWATQEEHQLDF